MCMMNFKSRSGFLLLEAVFATLILGMILGPLYMSQNAVVSRLSSAFGAGQRIFLAKQFLMENVLKRLQQADLPKQVDFQAQEPLTNLVFKQEPIPASSSLKSIKYLEKATVTFGWQWSGLGKSNTLTTFVFVRPELDDKKKDAA